MADEPGITPAPAPAPAADPAATPAPDDTTLLGAEPEGKPDGDKPADGVEGDKPADEKPAEEAKPEGAPEKYEDFKLPEGVTVDAAAVESFTPIAKELNLSQEQAQKLVDYFAKVRGDEVQASVKAVADLRTGWVGTAKADQEIGGAKFTENLSVAKTALDKFGTPQLRDALNQTGLGDHPEVIRFFHRVGRALAEDKVVTGSPGSQAKTLAERMYPNQTPS